MFIKNKILGELIMNFGKALEVLKEDPWNKVARTGWNGKGMWVHLCVPPTSPFSDEKSDEFEALPYLEMKTADNKFVPWITSQQDILAEDWMFINEVSMQEEIYFLNHSISY